MFTKILIKITSKLTSIFLAFFTGSWPFKSALTDDGMVGVQQILSQQIYSQLITNQ